MKATSMYIYLEGSRHFARHGVDPQETVVGSYFTIDVKLKTDFTLAAQTDDLDGTVSYADVHAILKEEMQTPSKLLEHVCQRIAEHLFRDFLSITEVHIRMSKENPPMGADCRNVGVEVTYLRI